MFGLSALSRVRPQDASDRFAKAATLATILIFSAIVVTMGIPLTSCSGAKQGKLTVVGGKTITYQCDTGETITARYFELSDKSLEFVKLQMPDGKAHTLPLALSASGARYTDDRELVWWTKGDTAFAQKRGENGEWQTVYNCREAQ